MKPSHDGVEEDDEDDPRSVDSPGFQSLPVGNPPSRGSLRTFSSYR